MSVLSLGEVTLTRFRTQLDHKSRDFSTFQVAGQMFIIFVCFRLFTACRFRQKIKNFVSESWRSRVVLFRHVGRDRFREKKKDRCLMGRVEFACGIITIFNYENDLHSWLAFPLSCSVSSGVHEHKTHGYFLWITTWVVVWHILHFHSKNWGNDPIWRASFFRWVVQPQTRKSPSTCFCKFQFFSKVFGDEHLFCVSRGCRSHAICHLRGDRLTLVMNAVYRWVFPKIGVPQNGWWK